MKCEKESRGATDTNPNHEKHRFQTNHAILQPKNKWLVNYSCNPHKQQRILATTTALGRTQPPNPFSQQG